MSKIGCYRAYLSLGFNLRYTNSIQKKNTLSHLQEKITDNCRSNNNNKKRKNMSRFKLKREVDDDLSVCMLNILPKVRSLPNLLAIDLVKVEI